MNILMLKDYGRLLKDKVVKVDDGTARSLIKMGYAKEGTPVTKVKVRRRKKRK